MQPVEINENAILTANIALDIGLWTGSQRLVGRERGLGL